VIKRLRLDSANREAKQNKKDSDKERADRYHKWLEDTLAYKREKYEDQKKRTAINDRRRAQAEAEKSGISPGAVTSAKDSDATGTQNTVQNVGHIADRFIRAAVGAGVRKGRSLLKKRKDAKQAGIDYADTQASETKAAMNQKFLPPGRSGPEKTDNTRRRHPGTSRTEPTPPKPLTTPGQSERLRRQGRRPRLPSAVKRPSGGPIVKRTEPNSSSYSGMSAGQRARVDPDFKKKLIQNRMEEYEYSCWREEFLYELGDLRRAKTEKYKEEPDKIVDVMKGTNKITINPKVDEKYQYLGLALESIASSKHNRLLMELKSMDKGVEPKDKKKRNLIEHKNEKEYYSESKKLEPKEDYSYDSNDDVGDLSMNEHVISEGRIRNAIARYGPTVVLATSLLGGGATSPQNFITTAGDPTHNDIPSGVRLMARMMNRKEENDRTNLDSGRVSHPARNRKKKEEKIEFKEESKIDKKTAMMLIIKKLMNEKKRKNYLLNYGYIGEARTPAWARNEGKDLKKGGLNRKGIASYRKEHPGSHLSMAVTTEPSKLKKGSKSWNRRKSFCSRSAGQMKMWPKAAKDPNSRLRQARRKWNC
jgi:hypothetical protein